MLKATKIVLLAAPIVSALSSAATAAPTQWAGNGHWYERVDVDLTWTQAKAAAEARSYLGLQGHLVTLTSQAENDWVWYSLPGVELEDWLGGYQPAGSGEPADDWRWVTGEPWGFSNWYSGQPNDDPAPEDCMTFAWVNGGKWNDVGDSGPRFDNGYIVEYEVPEPASVLLLAAGMAACLTGRRRRSRNR